MQQHPSLLRTAALAVVAIALSGAKYPAMAALPAPVFTTVCTPHWVPDSQSTTISGSEVALGTCKITADLDDCAVTLGCPAVVPAPGPLVSSETCPLSAGWTSITTQAECDDEYVNIFCEAGYGCTPANTQPPPTA
jgi:hypothetical protein